MSAPVNIVVLGANGQVGTEVCLYLAMQPDVCLTGLVRARYNAVLLELAGISHEVLNYETLSPAAATILSQADAVFDCTFPAGQQQQLVSLILHNARAVMAAMRRNSIYIHSSSISAFGMPPDSPVLRNYRFARTGYARVKRQAEQRITQLGHQHGIRTCHLRLGQVHGVLQSVTRQLFGLIDQGGFTAMGTANALCNVAFAHSVALACRRGASGAIADGQIETVVANPQWTLETLYDTYRQLASRDFQVNYRGSTTEKHHASLAGRLLRLAKPFRSMLEAQVLPLIPAFAPRLKGLYRVQETLRERSIRPVLYQSPPVYNLIGMVPGRITSDTQSSPAETISAFRQIQAKLEEALQHGVSDRC
jgi:nucleoside-diphosphate-sugar epimerase